MNGRYREGEADAPPLASCLFYCGMVLLIFLVGLFIVWLNVRGS